MEKIRAKVHMLPTESSKILKLNNGNILNYHKELQGDAAVTPVHLYFTTDEVIREGDWFITDDENNDLIHAIDEQWRALSKHEGLRELSRKIIASTDPNLGITDHRISPVPNFVDIPQPSQDFIKSYCKQGGIDEVDVEYNRFIPDWETDLITPYYDYKLKVDSHNTITIHLIKDSWDREEVIEICRSLYSELKGYVPKTSFNEWIEENL